MRKAPQILALVVVCSAVLLASDSAKTLFKKGVDAEARQDYGNQGQLQEALTLFEEAAAIHPSNDRAAQEVRRTQQMQARPPVMLNPISDRPVSALEMTNTDIKTIYETIGKLAGINVLFDPEYTPRQPLSVKLKGVSLQEALDSVALLSRTFWRAVTPNTIFVAQDSQTKRRELELNPISGQPVSALEMTNTDTKTIYETIGKLAGINVLFDPEYTPRQPLSVKLKGVSLQEALDSVALQSRTFWRAVTPNTIFVAQAP